MRERKRELGDRGEKGHERKGWERKYREGEGEERGKGKEVLSRAINDR